MLVECINPPEGAGDALELIKAGLKAGDPKKAVLDALKPIEFESYAKIFVVGFGKASALMGKAVEENASVEAGCILSTSDPGLNKISFREASHPNPSMGNVEASRELLRLAEKAGEGDLLLCLISGGGSSMFTVPEEGLSLKDLLAVNKLLLESGLKINDVNTVRKHLDKVKGGGLLKHACCETKSLIMSDVAGDDLSVIASGPTVHDESTFQDASRILRENNLWNKIPEAVEKHISAGLRGEVGETIKEGDGRLNRVSNQIIASNTIVRKAVCEKAGELGYKACEWGEETCTSIEAAKKHARLLQELESGTVAVSGGETTVKVAGQGSGGRNQEYVLALTAILKEDYTAAAVDTDGIDGYTDYAGAVSTRETGMKAAKAGLDPEKYLLNNDSNTFFKKTGGLIKTGPTGTNLNDLRLLVKY